MKSRFNNLLRAEYFDGETISLPMNNRLDICQIQHNLWYKAHIKSSI